MWLKKRLLVTALLLALLLQGAFSSALERTPSKFRATVLLLHLETGIEIDVINSFVFYESSWREKAIGPKGELGLCQLSPLYLPYFIKNFWKEAPSSFDPLDGNMSLVVGVRYLAFLKESLGSLTWALAAYNTGAGNVLRGRIPRSTQKYVTRILDMVEVYSNVAYWLRMSFKEL